jgi:hypothetical protein
MYYNVGENLNFMITNKSLENMAKFKYFGTAIKNQNKLRGD